MAKFKVVRGHTKLYIEKKGIYYPIGEVGSIIETKDKELITALTKSVCAKRIDSTPDDANDNASSSKKKSGGK